jgi:outer membrane murein-binding lipoprotein Lpp
MKPQEVPVKTSIISALSAMLILAGCASERSSDSIASLRAECLGGKLSACSAAGIHPQVYSNDAAVEASIGAALNTAVAAGTPIGKPRAYAEIWRPGEHR